MNLRAVWRNSFGFTFLELILGIALVSILAAVGTPWISQAVVRANQVRIEDQLYAGIFKAQSYAMANRDDEVWGVCVSGSNLRVFSGSCATPVFQQDSAIPNSVSVTGLSEFSFSLRGEPSAAQSITVSSAVDSSVISVNQAGGVEVN